MIGRFMVRPNAFALTLALLLPGSGHAQTALQPLQAPSGITALSGFVEDTAGAPLAHVRFIDGGSTTVSDSQGRFVLSYAPSGDSVLVVGGRRTGQKRKDDHGVYEVRVTVKAGATAVLPYTFYLPLIDHAHEIKIAAPTVTNLVVTNPSLPNVALHIPAGVTIRDVFGKSATAVSLTAVPADKPPFPLPAGLQLAHYFVVQPGGACLYGPGDTTASAQIYYPNERHELPGARGVFLRYDVAQSGWVSYGIGTVGTDGTQLVPDATTVIHDFDGACPPPVLPPDPKPLHFFHHEISAVHGSGQHD